MSELPEGDLVSVRIALAIDRTGKYAAMECCNMRDGEEFDYVLDDLEPGEARYFINVRVRKPADAMTIEVPAESVEAVAAALADQKETP